MPPDVEAKTDAPRAPRLRIELLGGFGCSIDGRPVAVGWYDRMRALLAYLAVEREQDHRREALAALLWGGSDPVTARGNLRRTLSDLRRALDAPDGTSLFAAGRSTLRFVPGASVDVLEFAPRAPMAALADDGRIVDLYRGEFMAGFSLPDSPDFEDWLLLQREALHRRALALLEHRADRLERDGDVEQALHFAARCADLDPWNEAALRRVMRLQAASGRSGAALLQFEACSRRLKQDLGVAPADETRRLAERIRNDETVPTPAPPIAAPAPAVPSRPERRRVTVLYCELTVSAAAGAGDPDDAHDPDDVDDAMERLAAPRVQCAEIVRRHGGYLVPMHGGGLLAYFGYPRSHEDSAVRAVRAALAIAAEAGRGIGVRTGVHTGPILTGTDPSLPDTVGRTSGIAIQLRRCVGPGETAVSGATHALVAGYVSCSALGARDLPDSARPVDVYRVDRDSGARTRLDASTRLTPFVGRRHEIARLDELWDEACRGSGSAVLLQGDPGIGKSRLVQALMQRLMGRPHAVRELRCFPEYATSAFHPVLTQVEAILGLSPADTPESRAARMARHVESTFPGRCAQAVAVLARLLSLPVPAQYRDAEPPPQVVKALTIDVLGTILVEARASLPVLLVAEDLHWADPSTLELLADLVTRPRAGAMLAVLTARTGFTAPPARVLVLGPLDDPDTARLAASVEGGLSPEAVRRIVARADGVPLFVEELAKDASRGEWADVPGTLHDLLASRMDQLDDARPVAQLAAAIGREFGTGLLRRAMPEGRRPLAASLDRLKASGLVVEVDDETCRFGHALIQEAAYRSLTRTDRRAAHLRIAQALQEDAPGRDAVRPEILAHHLSCAGRNEEAIGHWSRAGQQAIHGSANLEAIAHFRHALELLATQPESRERDATELSILAWMGPALHATQGYGSPDASRVTARMSTLRGRVGDGLATFQAEWVRLRNTMASVGPRGVPQAAMQLLGLAGDDPVGRHAAHYAASVGSFWLGDFEASRTHAEEAIGLYRPAHHAAMLDAFGEDLSVSYAGHLAWAHCFLGSHDRAHETCRRMLGQARAMDHPKTLAMALLFASMLARWLNDHGQVRAFSAEVIDIARRHGMAHWIETAEALHGWARVMQEGRGDLVELGSLAARLNAGAPAYSALRLCNLAELHMRLGRPDEALRLLAAARDDEEAKGTLQFSAERLRLEGECLLAASPPDEAGAEARFERAIAVARGQQALTLSLRAALSMARLWRRQGGHARARRLVAREFDGFSEGFGTPDLVEAAALLREPVRADCEDGASLG